MATATVTIPNTQWITLSSQILWLPRGTQYQQIDSALSAGGSDLFLATLYIPITISANLYIALSNSRSQVSSISGQDFTTEMETDGTITFTASDDSSVTIDFGSDTTEPYFWAPNDADLATWGAKFAKLTDKTLRVTFDDNAGVAVAMVADQNGRRGTAYNQALPAASGGTSPYTYTVTGLPAGLTFASATRTISGTPTAEGTFTITYTATDSATPATTASVMFDLVVAAPVAVSIPAIDPQSAGRGSKASVQLPAASGGIGSFTYAATGLPDGLTFDPATRRITGTPTTEGAATVTYTAADSDTPTAGTASRTFTFTITAPTPLALDEVSDQKGQRGAMFSLELPEASGGIAPYSYTATDLPAGLTFDDDALTITGTPNAAGTDTLTHTVTYTAADSDSPASSVARTFEIVIAGELALDTPAAQQGHVGSRFTVQLPEAKGGTPPYTYTVSENLPNGLTFNAPTRVITGVPTGNAEVTVTYTVTDAVDASVARTFSLRVTTRPDTETYRLEVDWDGDGTFGNALANVWDDLLSVDTERGRNFEEMVYGRSVAGRLDSEPNQSWPVWSLRAGGLDCECERAPARRIARSGEANCLILNPHLSRVAMTR